MPTATATSDDILRVARTLIIAGGYNGFSYADIAEVVGIRKASIHHHFPTKVDLVRTLLQRYHEEVEAGITESRNNLAPAAQLRTYIGFWQECIGDATAAFCVCALLANEIPILPDAIAAELRTHFATLSEWLTSVLEQGADQGAIILTDSAHAEAQTVIATVHGAMLSARAYGDSHVFDVITNALLDRLMAR